MATAIRRAWQKGQPGLCVALVRCGSCSNLHTKHNFPKGHVSVTAPWLFRERRLHRAQKRPNQKQGDPKSRRILRRRATGRRAKQGLAASISPVHGSAARLLRSTLTDEFAFRRISRIDVRALPIRLSIIGKLPPALPRFLVPTTSL